MRALAHAGVPIEERWDPLLALDLDPIAILPPARRDAALIRLAAAERSQSHAAMVVNEALERFGNPTLLKCADADALLPPDLNASSSWSPGARPGSLAR